MVALDNQLVMDVGDYIHAPQCVHGVAEDIPAYGLSNVFHQLGAIRFYPRPLLGNAQPHIGDGLAAELILADTGLDIGEPSAAREFYEHHAALIDKIYAVGNLGDAFTYAPFGG